MQKLITITFLFCFLTIVSEAKFWRKNGEISPSPTSKGRGIGIAIHGGTLGTGTSLQKGLSLHFALQAAYHFGNLNQKAETSFGSDAVSLDANIKLGAASLILDYYPSIHSSFHFSTGMAYNFNNYNVDITPKGNQTYGFVEYTPSQVGTITFDISGANYAPYLGFGFGRAIPKRRIGFGFDLGAYYHGNPSTKLICTGTFIPSNTPENQSLVQRAFEGFNFFPFLNFKLSVKLKK